MTAPNKDNQNFEAFVGLDAKASKQDEKEGPIEQRKRPPAVDNEDLLADLDAALPADRDDQEVFAIALDKVSPSLPTVDLPCGYGIVALSHPANLRFYRLRHMARCEW